MIRKEAELYNPIVHGALSQGVPLYRIADGSPGKKPFDIGGCLPNGIAVGMEVKLLRDITPEQMFEMVFPKSIFELHQITWLGTYGKSRALSIAALCCQIEPRVLYCFRVSCPEDMDRKLKELDVVTLVRHQTTAHYLGWDHMRKRWFSPRAVELAKGSGT